MANADLGAIRTLVVSMRLQDAGVTQGLARTTARANAASVALGRTTESAAALQSQFFFLGTAAAAVTAGLVNRAAVFEEEMTKASLAATGTTAAVGELSDETFELARRFNAIPTEMAKTIRTVQELGIESDAARQSLTSASAALSLFAGEDLSRETAAQTLFRLIRLTSASQEELEASAASAEAYASSIEVAGDATAGGIQRSVEAIEAFSSLGAVASFSAGEIISLASAFTDVESGRFRRVSRSILRIFGREFVEEESLAKITNFLDVTPEQFKQLRKESPVETLILFGEALRSAQQETGETIPLLRELGFENIRDEETLAQLIASIEKFQRILPQTRAEIDRFNEGNVEGSAFMTRLEAQTGTTISQFRGLVGILEEVAIQMGNVAEFGVLPLLGGLKALGRAVADNPLLAGLLVGGAGILTGGALLRLGKAAFGAAAKGVPGPLRSIAGRGLAGGAATRSLLFSSTDDVAEAIVNAQFRRPSMGGQLGFIPARSIANPSLAGRASRFFTQFASPRMLAVFSKGISWASALSLAAPALEETAKLLSRISDQSSALGSVASVLEALALTAALVGNTINAAIGLLIDGADALHDRFGDALKGALGGAATGAAVGAFGGPIGAGGGALVGFGAGLFGPEIRGITGAASEGLRRGNRFVNPDASTTPPGAAAQGDQQPQVVQNNTIYNGEPDQIQRTLEDVGSSLPFQPRSKTRRGSPS